MGTRGARRVRVTITGRVQAVGFRQFVWGLARRLDLVGWVRNGDDGRSVQVEAEGAADAVEELVALLREGPPGSRVDAVESEWQDETSGYRGFDVRF